MDYRVEYRKGSLAMAEFRRRYQDRERFIGYCRECPRYDAVWSCPSLAFDADEYLERFAWVNVLGAKAAVVCWWSFSTRPKLSWRWKGICARF